MDTSTSETVEVGADSAAQIEERLNLAVQYLQPLASRNRHGILVTRLNPGQHSICLSEDVPFGLTRERSR